jgi:DNA-binding FrmR family transcriptional regulator
VTRAALAALVLAVAVGLASGCGGSDDGGADTSATTEWAGDLCSAITTWTQSLTDSVDSLGAGSVTRDSLQGVVDDASGATQSFMDELEALGRPDTAAGEQAEETVAQLRDELSEQVQAIEDALEGVSGAGGVLTAVSAVSGALAEMGRQLSAAFGDLQQLDAQGELEDAFREAPSCDDLTSGS